MLMCLILTLLFMGVGHATKVAFVCVHACVCVYVCVCVRERERECVCMCEEGVYLQEIDTAEEA